MKSGVQGPAVRSIPRTYQTRRAWASLVRATGVARHGTAAWTWLHAPRAENTLEFWGNRTLILLPSAGGTEAVDPFPRSAWECRL